jgi:hypothetical protein
MAASATVIPAILAYSASFPRFSLFLTCLDTNLSSRFISVRINQLDKADARSSRRLHIPPWSTIPRLSDDFAGKLCLHSLGKFTITTGIRFFGSHLNFRLVSTLSYLRLRQLYLDCHYYWYELQTELVQDDQDLGCGSISQVILQDRHFLENPVKPVAGRRILLIIINYLDKYSKIILQQFS